MRFGLIVPLLLTLAACAGPKDVAELQNDQGTLRFAMNDDGVQLVSLCAPNAACVPAPDGEYTTRDGLMIPVTQQNIRFFTDPKSVVCNYERADGQEKLECEDRD